MPQALAEPETLWRTHFCVPRRHSCRRSFSFTELCKYALASCLLLVPCFWQSRIQAGDLSSHLYNAWLVQLVEQGKAPGITVARQWTNVLFDLELSAIWKLAGPQAAERIAVATAVLIFVWGAFALAGVIAGRRPWFLLPCIGMLAYGWVFHAGFFNFHLSLGLCLWALAWLWRPAPARVAAAVVALAIAYVAHALPVVWAVCVIGYACLARNLRPRYRAPLILAGLAAVVMARWLIMTHLATMWWPQQITLLSGADQLRVYGARYGVLEAALLLIWGAMIVRRRALRLVLGIPFGIGLLTAYAVLMIPSRIHVPGYQHALVFIADRMSLCVAVAVCALAAAVRPRRAETAALAALAMVFFCFLYVDDRAANLAEDDMQAALAGLAPYQRVVNGLSAYSGRLDQLGHTLDRACIGRCFSYANYEPATAQFRVRAGRANPVVAADYRDSFGFQSGRYVIKPEDTPIYAVVPHPAGRGFSVRSLRPGESAPVAGIDWEKWKWAAGK